MKRWIIYLLMAVITAAGIPASAHAADRDRGHNSKNSSTLKMKPRKLSKRTAKLRKTKNKERKKQMSYIKKSNQQKNKSKKANK